MVVDNAKPLKGEKKQKQPHPPLRALQILKLYAWEPSFQTQVEDIRNGELVVMKKFAYLTSVSTFIFSCAPALVSRATKLVPPLKKKIIAWTAVVTFPLAVSLLLRCHWPRLQCLSE